MENDLDKMIHYIAKSHKQLARILEAKRYVAVHSAGLLKQLRFPGDDESEPAAEQSLLVTKSISAYLNGFAELEETLADSVKLAITELQEEGE